MGGIMVMGGGVLSALIVGFILESRGLYANVVADSYAQAGDDDKEFWDRLSDEEAAKARELIAKLKESKGEKMPEPEITMTKAAATATAKATEIPPPSPSKPKEETPKAAATPAA